MASLAPEDLLGLPFVLLPGRPADHVVCGVAPDGGKVRAGALQLVFNDMLLKDALCGSGAYRGSIAALPRMVAILELAEQQYGDTSETALAVWLLSPRSRGPLEWVGVS